MPLSPTRLYLNLGLGCLLLPPAWFWLVSDSARREWVLTQPGLSGMGGGPAQLWALVPCWLAAALLLTLARLLRRRQATA